MTFKYHTRHMLDNDTLELFQFDAGYCKYQHFKLIIKNQLILMSWILLGKIFVCYHECSRFWQW